MSKGEGVARAHASLAQAFHHCHLAPSPSIAPDKAQALQRLAQEAGDGEGPPLYAAPAARPPAGSATSARQRLAQAGKKQHQLKKQLAQLRVWQAPE
eukprot:7762484-Pyramimonas_sp.AAC.1